MNKESGTRELDLSMDYYTYSVTQRVTDYCKHGMIPIGQYCASCTKDVQRVIKLPALELEEVKVRLIR